MAISNNIREDTDMYLNLKTVLINKLRSFCKHCTMHGFYYFSESRSRLIYLIWSVIIILGLTLSIILGEMIWYKFSIDPTFTVVENARYPTTNIKFPSVTVCNNEIVYFGPKTENISSILSKRGFTETQIEEFFQSFSAVKNPSYKPNSYVNNMHSFLHSLGYGWDDLIDMFKTPCDALIKSCMWRSKSHNCSEMFRDYFTYTGHCCRFNIAYFRKNADPVTAFIGGVETVEALKINIKVPNETQHGTVNSNHISVYVLDEAYNVTPTDTSITVSQAAAYYDVGVHVWAIDSSDDVKALATKNRKCIFEKDSANGYSYVSHQECLAEMVLKAVVSRCHCLPFHYSANDLQTEELPRCSFERLLCVYQNIANIQSDMENVLKDETCLNHCDYVHYETETNSVRLRGRSPTTATVAVHFRSHTCLKYRREVLYTWDQMLANLGGIFGLCLGGSIISIIELVWFILDVLLTTIFVCKGNKTRHEQSERVFTISQRNLFNKDIRKSKKLGKFKYVN